MGAADEFLRALARDPPRTLRAFEALAGPLYPDFATREWSGVYRAPVSDALASASLTFDPFRGDEDDPALESLRLCVRLEHPKALGLLSEVFGPPQEGVVETQPAARWGDLNLREHRGDVLVDWQRPQPAPVAAAFDPAVRDRYLNALLGALAIARTGPELRTAVTPPPGAGVALRAQPATIRDAAGNLVPARVPLVSLDLQPPGDALAVAAAWGIEQPVAVSGDVHQATWWMLVGGELQHGDWGAVMVTAHARAGRFSLRPRLAGRPPGPLPDARSGASPAYDIRATGGAIVAIEITPEA